MRKLALLPVLILFLATAAGCLINSDKPVAWKIAEVKGKAVKVEDGTWAWHMVTVKNTGGTTARNVELSFRMPGLCEYGDGISSLKPGKNYTISRPARVFKNVDHTRYLHNYEGDGTVIIKWEENGVQKSKTFHYTGKYHPKAPEPDRPSQHNAEKTMSLYLSPRADYLLQSAGPVLSYYTPGNPSARTIWTTTELDYWECSYINWDSSGRRFIFTSISYPGDNWYNIQSELWLADLQKQNTMRIFKGKGWQPGQWSPDGRYILFLYQDEKSSNKRIHREAMALSLYDTKTAQSRLLISGADKQHIANPLWSPDSRRIIYDALLEDDSYILAVYDLEKGTSEKITATKRPYFPRAWSKDGRKVFYDTGGYGCIDFEQHQIGYYDLSARQDHPLTGETNEYGPSNRFVSISPDGQTLLFSKDPQGPKGELWQINLQSGKKRKVYTGDRIYNVFWTSDSVSYIYKDSQSSVRQSFADRAESRQLLPAPVILQHIYKGQLYYFEISYPGLLREYTLKSMNLTNGKVRTIMSLPEYTPPQDKSKTEQDFGFILRYGVGAKNELNTLEGTFTKDLVTAGRITAPMVLSKSELDSIFKEMVSIHIMDYPDTFIEKSPRMVTPYLTYDITIHYQGKSQRIYWKDKSWSESREATQLRNLINRIISMAESRPEYKKLPPAEGGYD